MRNRIFLGFIFLSACLIWESQTQRLRGRINSRTFTRDMSAVPPGSATLAFVFDVTGSMWDDLRQVIAGAKKILDTSLSRQDQPLYDYVLIPFHDPVVGPITVTTNGDLFQRQLKDLYVQGGGDCPEMSLTAIREALEISLPSSFIYVFTDATSKDYDQLREVLKIIQKKQSQVVFVLTGDCNNRDSPGYKAYEKIAATSSGQIFLISRDDVSEVVKFIEVSVQAHKVVLLATDHDRAGEKTWEIPFDPELREVTLSLSGPHRRLRLFNPQGRQVTARDGLETLLDLDTVLILNIKNATAGTWRVKAYSSGEHSLRVTGLSILDFQARFSRRATLDWSNTEYQPVEGADTYVLLNATGLPPPGEFRDVYLRDIAGEAMQNIPLDPPPDPAQPYLYAVRPFLTPTIDFYIYVHGVTHEGYKFVRATKNAILNVVPVAPSVYMKPTYPGYFEYPAEIPCEVTSLIPFHVSWSRKFGERWQVLGERTYHEQTQTVYYRIPEITDGAEGYYRCIANNSKGIDYGETFLDVEERPPTIRIDGNVTVAPGSRAVLTCHVTSNIKYAVAWSRVDGKPFDTSRARILSNYSLVISRTRPADEGGYKCTATNKGGEAFEKIFLTLQSIPTVYVRPVKPVRYTANDTVSLRCIARGYPDPTIAWLKGSEFLTDDKVIKIRRENTELRFYKAQKENEGVYTCQATNKAGSSVATGRLIYSEMPTARLDEETRLVGEGTSTVFECQVTGIPAPRITWVKEGYQIATGARYQISDEGVLTIASVARNDEGEYTCMVSNELGRASASINLLVGTIPVIVRPPTDTGIDIDNRGYLPCAAEGYPEPEITWSKREEAGAEDFAGGIVGVFEIVIDQEEDRVYHDPSSNNLIINDMGLDDKGAYICTASNQFGSDSKTAIVDVTGLVRPRITITDDRPHVIVGQSIALPCRITSGNPAPTREWLREGLTFEPIGRVSVSGEGSVVVTSARVDDAGEYVCTARNVAGRYDVTIDLDVWVPPTITTPETDYTTIQDRSITLRCDATGNPDPSVQWTKVGVRGPLRYLPDYNVLSDNSLVIASPTPEHNGDYTCTASNPAGRTSIQANLVVYYKPGKKEGSLDEYTVIEGDSITMECPVTESNPPPVFTWSFGRTEIVYITGEYEMSDDGRLKIVSSRVSDDGEYTCTAVNRAGSFSHKMALTVYVPPRILRGPSVIRGLEGEDISLKCEATGIPLPQIKWRNNDVEVVGTGRLSLRSYKGEYSSSSEIFIHPARLTDDGDFVCVAINIAGKMTSTTRLDVQKRPTIDSNQFDNNLTPSRGSQLSIPCVAQGDPTPVVRWFHNGREITGDELDIDIATNGSLILYSVNNEDNGVYRCEAENSLGKVDIEAHVTVYEPPEITGSGDTTKFWVYEGHPATMYCYAEAVPKPVVNWYKVEHASQRLLHDERNHIEILGEGETLNITISRVSDTGRYFCNATNIEGSSFRFYELDVYVLPSIKDGDLTGLSRVVLGDDFTLECPVKGIPFPTIKWFKGLIPISVEDENMLIDNRGQTLTVLNSELEHDGEYSCVADNGVGDASKLFDVAILVPPQISGGDMDHTVQVTRYLAIECRASGVPKPNLSWYKDGRSVPISNTDNQEEPRTLDQGRYLEFASIRVEDEGIYKCEAVNDAGSDHRIHNVNVQVPPDIGGEDIPANISVVKGDDITLTCHATGDPPPTISWLKNGVAISTGGRYVISESGAYLDIYGAQESDRGQYTCRASNDVGVVTQNQYLDVLVEPSIDGPEEDSIIVQKGDTVYLDCFIAGNPVPRIRWEKNGRPVSETAHIRFTDDGQRLVIINADETDTSQYTCTASNIIGDDRKAFILNVHVPPTITPFKKDIYEVIEGERISITCEATGIPTPTVTWLKGSEAISKSRFYKFREEGNQIVIMQADVDIHEGDYTCIATNAAGDNEKDVGVSVLIPPAIYGEERIDRRVVNEGNEVVMDCKVKRGKPEPVIRWFRGHNNFISRLSTVWNYNLVEETLSNVRSHVDNTGAYWCEASNLAGSARKNFTLDVQVRPFIDGDERENKNVILNNDATFTCKVSGVPMPDVTWTKDDNPISTSDRGKYVHSREGQGTFHLTVLNSQEEDQGTYKCIATNDAGDDFKETHLDVYLPPTFDNENIVTLTVLENEYVELLCDVNAFPKPTIRWYKDGRPLVISREVLEALDDDRILPIPSAQLSDAGQYKCEAENVAGTRHKLFKLNVHSIPKVVGPAVDEITKLVGDQIDMVCEIQGTPAPALTWTKNGEPLVISNEEKMTLLSGSKILRIFHAELGDTGQFECHGINVAGRAVKSFDVTIHESSRILGNPHETYDINKGEEFTLECLVLGTPRPVIKWYKDGRKIHDDFRHLISEEGRYLAVTDVHENDAGRYVCNASNIEAYDTKAFTINVRVPPTIEEGPDRQWVKEHQNINLTCNARSNSRVQIEWSYDGEPIVPSIFARPSPQGKRLMLFNVKREKAGKYTCTATNAAGFADKDIQLDVYTTPVIVGSGQMDTYNVTKTESVTLECDVTGFPEPIIEWLKDFSPIYFLEDGTAQIGNYEIHDGGRLFTLYDAHVYDEGIYKCRATNQAGFDAKEYDVNVFVPPQIYREGLSEDIIAREKSYVRIQCAASGLPTPTIRWLKDGFAFVPSEKVTVSNHFEDHHSFLAFQSIDEVDAGTYSCVAENPAGQDVVELDIIVNVPPKIRGSEDPYATQVEVVVGETLDLECEVIRGVPEPEIEWFKRSRKLMGSERVKILADGRYLRIPQARPDDYGVYTCVARNSEGADSKEFNVLTLEHPQFTGDEKDVVDVILGFSHFITCDIDAQPQPRLEWFKDGEPLVSDGNVHVERNGRILFIKSARLEDEGTYMCRATNKAGSDDKLTKINILTPPSINDDVGDNDVDVMLDRPTYLNCSVQGFPQPTIVWFRNGIKVDLEDENFATYDDGQILSIGSARLSDSGRYDCHARNTAGRDRKDFRLNVQVAPTISGPDYEDLVLLEGRYYELDCFSSGIPDPDNEWFKDNTAVTKGRRYSQFRKGHTLGIYGADDRDNGIFLCEATNVAGTARKTFNVTVYMSPKLTDSTKYKELIVNQGNDITLNCESHTYPTPKVMWIKNGKEITRDQLNQDRRIQIMREGFLLAISNAQPDDAAQYSCELSNDAGATSRNFNLIVNTPPDIDGPERQDIVKPVDSTISMDCSVQGYPIPSIIWLKNGSPLQLSDRMYIPHGQNTLRIDRALETDKGLYSCIASNEAGDDRKDFDVDILVRPLIDDSEGEENIDAILGEEVTLACPIIRSNPPATVTWYKDGQEVGSAHAQIRESGEIFVLTRAEIADAGKYTCVARNGIGQDDRSFSLNILVPPAIGYRNTSHHVEVNQTFEAILECDIIGGQPPPQITWTHNNFPVQMTPRVRTFAEGKILEIHRSLTSDTGFYKCTATNEAGQVSDTIRLDVYVPPEFENGEPENIVRIEGEPLELECYVRGVPPPDMAWTKSVFGEEAYPLYEGRVVFDQYLQSAIIEETRLNDTGLYSCIASSIAGYAQKLFNVSILIPPSISGPEDTQSITVVQGDTFALECPVSGVPLPEVTWLKNGRPLPLLDASRIRNDGQQLYIESAQLNDIGTYTCVARSDAGEDSRNFDVDVHVPPTGLDGEVEITAVTGSDVKLECDSDAKPPPTFSWFKDGRPIGQYGHLLLLKNVQTDDTALYTCEARNDAGKSEQLIRLTVFKKPTIEPGPLNVIALLHETVKFMCVADGVPQPEVSWWKDSAEIPTEDNDKYRRVGDALEIADIQLIDSGIFMCLATNDAGSARRQLSLIVQERPAIARGETNITVLANEPVTLPCEASGTPQPVVTWTKDSRSYYAEQKLGYRQAESGSIHISAASVLDTGYYTCNVENDAGTTFRDIQLFVQVPPSIANAVTKYIVEPSSRLLIPCDASGVPTPTVKWTRDGVDAEQLIGIYVNQRDNSLDIPSVGLLHQAVYRCSAENPAGQTHYEAEVKVRTVPVIAKPKQTVTALEGSTTVLPCEAVGTPEPTINWRRGSHLIDIEEGRFSQDLDNSLRISNVQVYDDAGYTCVAQNVAGTAFGQVKLDVQVLPGISTDINPSQVAIAGQSFTFPITTSGLPEPFISWLKDGYALNGLDDSHFVKQEDGSLLIPIVLPTDEGNYNVSALNAAGETWMSFNLRVIIPPDIRAESTEIAVIQGGQIHLNIEVTGEPRPEVTWTKDGEPINTADVRTQLLSSGSLIINNVMSTDSGYYIATAINDAGRDSAEMEVIVQVPPTFTDTPGDQKIQSGDDLQMVCSAVGYPVPNIIWKFNNKLVPGLKARSDGPGSSRLIITNVRSQDAGTYMCQASNPAGIIMYIASVTVDSPPVFTNEHDPDVIGRIGESVMINCPVTANPIPTITWTKDGEEISIGHRLQQLHNGSLIIHNTVEEDAGDYKCVASNEAGSVERVTKLILEVAPTFLITPSDTTAVSGSSVIFNCTAAGVPTPEIEWRKSSRLLPIDGRFNVLHNNSLQIITTQLEDTGEFECIARNHMGSRMAKAFLTVQVHGRFGDWNQFGPCSSTCGAGTQTRIRFCNSPPPANGGDNCVGSNEDTRTCQQGNCPVNGNWADFGSWEPCSVTCGQGLSMRTRECSNPPAQYGGLPCTGKAVEKRMCSRPKCAINGNWGSWGVWLPCSTSCGEGMSVRTRRCNNPAPSIGGEKCSGPDTSSRVCNLQVCPVRGNWASWGSFSICSVSCGGGTRDRVRTCTDPAPSSGGELCPGSNVQLDNCNAEPCPLNGNWAGWGIWSSCSQTCGGGQQRKYRSCSEPRPLYGGKHCSGSDALMRSCGLVPCPEDGGWSEWSDWTPCGVTCGAGTKKRLRTCSNPPPLHNGKFCEGDSTQTDQCALQVCQGGPKYAVGTIFGNVNDIPISGSSVISHGIPIGDDKTRIVSVIKDIPKALGPDLRNQVSILTPIYWTFAREIEGAYNGHTLTGGNFERLVTVEFPSGEIVEMHHNARGVDKDGNLLVDIEINGHVPMFPPTINLGIKDYFEEYLQTGPDSLYAYSDRFYTVDGEIMLYTWNHTIYYDESYGVMPYLVEQLFGTDIVAEYDQETLELMFQIDVAIGKGDPSNECPFGFLLDESGQYCYDEDECETQEPCSDICKNLKGTYYCECLEGFHIGSDGNTCEDIDECEENISECEAPYVCQNTRGTYKCALTCGPGLETSEDGQTCQDLDECSTSTERICEHLCNNTYGSYRCNCRIGYQRVGETQCIDIDECLRGACGGNVRHCHNTPGSYFCTNTCPSGYYLNDDIDSCVDIDECLDVDLSHCQHECENVPGSYRCVCFPGYTLDWKTGRCEDLNECADGRGPCQYGCRNTDGTYRCYCPTGYKLNKNGHSCTDIDECLEGEAKCIGNDVLCANTLGTYKCVNIRCPPQYKMKNGVCTRDCLDDECPNKFKSIIRYNSTFLRVGVPQNQDLLELAVSYANASGELEMHSNTRFRLLTPRYERAWRLFGLRVVNDARGVVYTKMAITRQFIDWYRLRVSARSSDVEGTVEYETIFNLFINVAPNPFI